MPKCLASVNKLRSFCALYALFTERKDLIKKKKKTQKFYKLTIRVVSCVVSLVLILRISNRLAFKKQNSL